MESKVKVLSLTVFVSVVDFYLHLVCNSISLRIGDIGRDKDHVNAVFCRTDVGQGNVNIWMSTSIKRLGNNIAVV